MQRKKLVYYLNSYLDLGKFRSDSSQNGLQVEGNKVVSLLATAVDASMVVFEKARQAGAQMILVHHGLFWKREYTITGIYRQRIQYLLDHDLSLYAAHLPLDAHPEVGNNVELARVLGLEILSTFGDYRGITLGLKARTKIPMSCEEIAHQLETRLNTKAVLWSFGRKQVKKIAIVSGDAASMLDQAVAAGVDLFITGETDHVAFHYGREERINVLYLGHYASETLGVQSLARHLTEQFGLPQVFLDVPTGL